jgi:pantoate--beta-alanine ligase
MQSAARLMKITRSLQALRTWRDRLQREGVIIGCVPTMGALHDGHRALIRAARMQCDALVVTIFVNPTQFGPTEDLAKYPRPIGKDRALCREEGVDLCFEPTAASMYPDGFQTVVSVPALARRWEGEVRPHHFAGVATVVTKLFSLIRPHRAWFGQKDFQQAALVQQLVKDLNLGVAIIVRPTIREADGLAMSSRNVYLSAEERATATILHASLRAGAAAIRQGLRDGKAIEDRMTAMMLDQPSASVDYLAVCDPVSLEPLATVAGRTVLLGAIRLGRIRLIDNLIVHSR